jgi:acyl-CoA-binding protein
MSEDLRSRFIQAAEDVIKLSKEPDNEIKLQLYSLYKQSIEGDYTNGKKPGMMDFVGKIKYDAWRKLEGTTKEEAMQFYVELVDSLKDE